MWVTNTRNLYTQLLSTNLPQLDLQVPVGKVSYVF